MLIDILFKSTKMESQLKPCVLEDLCTFISRGISPNYDDESDALVLGQTCIRNHIVSLNNARTLLDKDYGLKAVQRGDILVNSTGVGSLGRVAQIDFQHPKLVADSHITIVRPKELYREYLGCHLMSIEDEIENMAEGSTGQTELPRSRFSQIIVSVPNDATLKKFSDRIRPIRQQIQTNIDEINKLESIRGLILPKLMSGEIDVSTLDLPTKYSFGGASCHVLLVCVLHIFLINHRIMQCRINSNMSKKSLYLFDWHPFVYCTCCHGTSKFMWMNIVDVCRFL